MKKIFKSLFYLLLFPLFVVALYFFIAYTFTFFPKNSEQPTQLKSNTYLLYSEIHSDIVFNINEINLTNFPIFKNKKTGYLAFGWGDEETYLNTPNIKNIKISTSIKALLINTPSLMHISYIADISRYQSVKSLQLSKPQKERLKTSIMKSFNFQGKRYQGYGREDFFYTANAHYNLINTCNTWTGEKLRESNISMPYWTPFVWSITNALP